MGLFDGKLPDDVMREKHPEGHVAYGTDKILGGELMGQFDDKGSPEITPCKQGQGIFYGEMTEEQKKLLERHGGNMDDKCDQNTDPEGHVNKGWSIEPDPFDDIEKFRLTEKQLKQLRPVSSKPTLKHRVDSLETLVKRIAAHLGIEG